MRGNKKMATSVAETSIKAPINDMEGQRAVITLEDAFNQHWLWVCRVLYSLVVDWDEAEDLALQVFTKFYQHPPRDTAKLGSWLHRVATNAGLNALRSRQRRRYYEEIAGVLRLQQARAQNPAEEIENRETRRLVWHVLAGMRPRAAQILVLRTTGLSYAQIAEAMHIAPGSVGTLLGRAEKVFAQRYQALEESK
jgi:RNA polymerase sigma-70 factor (ECF subfamily)